MHKHELTLARRRCEARWGGVTTTCSDFVPRHRTPSGTSQNFCNDRSASRIWTSRCLYHRTRRNMRRTLYDVRAILRVENVCGWERGRRRRTCATLLMCRTIAVPTANTTETATTMMMVIVVVLLVELDDEVVLMDWRTCQLWVPRRTWTYVSEDLGYVVKQGAGTETGSMEG